MRLIISTFLMLLFISFFAAGGHAAPVRNTGIITGKMTGKNGESLGGGMVLLYFSDIGAPPSREKYWRMPDRIERMDDNGFFTAKVPEGNYYLGAIKRKGGKRIGPPEEGDLVFISHEGAREIKRYVVKKGETLDLGTMAKAVPYRRETAGASTITAVEGTFVDPDQKPVEKALIFGYISPEMSGRPVYVSEYTSKDGKFTIRLPGAGTYYIKARTGDSGGPPVVGEVSAVYGGDRPKAITVPEAAIMKGITIHGKVVTARKAVTKQP